VSKSIDHGALRLMCPQGEMTVCVDLHVPTGCVRFMALNDCPTITFLGSASVANLIAALGLALESGCEPFRALLCLEYYVEFEQDALDTWRFSTRRVTYTFVKKAP
jgi:hypothetical protein